MTDELALYRFEWLWRELEIEVCDVDVRGGRLRVIDKEGGWGGRGGSDGDGGYGERTMIIAARSCERVQLYSEKLDNDMYNTTSGRRAD